MKINKIILGLSLTLIMSGCSTSKKDNIIEESTMSTKTPKELVNQYVKVPLKADLSHFDKSEKMMLSYLFAAADIMNNLFWQQNYGTDKDKFLASIEDANLNLYARINYGPWDQFDNQLPFIKGYGKMPLGAAYYPIDMTAAEFEAWDEPTKTSPYTMIRRDKKGNLQSIWFHEAFKDEVSKAAECLNKAALYCQNPQFKKYLNMRATALLSDQYKASDKQWMDVRDSNVDFVIGPIENYVDALYGYKTAYEAFVLIKDMKWSKQLEHYVQFLPQLQHMLPVEDRYKQEEPGRDADLAVYDVLYYAGDCNMAGKTIAINLPNDEEIQLSKGTRKLQLKNAMQAKFDNILVPIAQQLMTPESMKHINFDAFFANVMFHEVAHGLGIKNTLDNEKTPVRIALKEQYSALEEAKADVLGLFLVTKLYQMGEYKSSELIENYTTFMAGIFRSVRFGAASAHGRANMLTFNYFLSHDAFARNSEGLYSINFDQMQQAVENLANDIIVAQGDGKYETVKKWLDEQAVMDKMLNEDLKLIKRVPVDIYFEMGPEINGLQTINLETLKK